MKQLNDLTASGLASNRPDVIGKSTVIEVRNKLNVSSLSRAEQQQSSRFLAQTGTEIMAQKLVGFIVVGCRWLEGEEAGMG